jgi:hypothetical protein
MVDGDCSDGVVGAMAKLDIRSRLLDIEPLDMPSEEDEDEENSSSSSSTCVPCCESSKL